MAEHGYDTKYAMHALRLGVQGVEFLSTDRITLPVPVPDRWFLRAVRRGEVPVPAAVTAVEAAEARLLDLRQHATVPEQPDRAWVDAWLHRSYLDHRHANGSPQP